MKGRHYLTIVTRDGCYSECGHPLRRGGEAVYRYEPREILCRTCAELRGLEPRPSRSWQRANRRTRSRYLSATLSHHGDYEAAIGDPHYRATSPLAPAACRCFTPGHYFDHESREGPLLEVRPR